MKYSILTLLTATLLSSCSSYTFKQMESFASKMTRFQPLTADKYNLPQIKIEPKLIRSAKEHRTPASTSGVAPQVAKNFNNKKLYISTLLQQYNEMQAFTDESAPQVNHCPHFHNTFIEMQESGLMTPVAKVNWEKNYSAKDITKLTALNPELSLPITYSPNGPTVADMPTQQWKEYTQKAINIYIGKMYNEIHTLCYQGVSQSYFKFENMVTTKRVKLSQASLKSMQILLKNPLYVNQLLIKSLHKGKVKANHRTIASTKKNKKIVSEVYQRFNTNWFNSYVNQL